MTITAKSAVDVTDIELHLWILQHPECWSPEKDCFDNQKLRELWEKKYGTLNEREVLNLATVAHVAKHTAYSIRQHCTWHGTTKTNL